MSRRGKSPRARLGAVLPFAGLAGIGLTLAIATRKVGWVVRSLPFTDTPNGFTLFCLLVLVAGCWWRMRQAETTPHPSLDVLLDLDDLEQEPWRKLEKWPLGPGAPFAELDPDEARPTVLPFDARRVRS